MSHTSDVRQLWGLIMDQHRGISASSDSCSRGGVSRAADSFKNCLS